MPAHYLGVCVASMLRPSLRGWGAWGGQEWHRSDLRGPKWGVGMVDLGEVLIGWGGGVDVSGCTVVWM